MLADISRHKNTRALCWFMTTFFNIEYLCYKTEMNVFSAEQEKRSKSYWDHLFQKVCNRNWNCSVPYFRNLDGPYSSKIPCWNIIVHKHYYFITFCKIAISAILLSQAVFHWLGPATCWFGNWNYYDAASLLLGHIVNTEAQKSTSDNPCFDNLSIILELWSKEL